MPKLLLLTDGFVSLVDDDVHAWASRERWSSRTRSYVRTQRKIDGKWKWFALHRLITNAPPDFVVDHINGDPRDNRRANLRIATKVENGQNRLRAQPNSRTGIRGVEYIPDASCYRAYLYVRGKKFSLGRHATLEAAALAAAKGRRQLMTHAPECVPTKA